MLAGAHEVAGTPARGPPGLLRSQLLSAPLPLAGVQAAVAGAMVGVDTVLVVMVVALVAQVVQVDSVLLAQKLAILLAPELLPGQRGLQVGDLSLRGQDCGPVALRLRLLLLLLL